ncbi:hypothetical protein ACQJBY_052412 [Aegilops geniculata]
MDAGQEEDHDRTKEVINTSNSRCSGSIASHDGAQGPVAVSPGNVSSAVRVQATFSYPSLSLRSVPFRQIRCPSGLSLPRRRDKGATENQRSPAFPARTRAMRLVAAIFGPCPQLRLLRHAPHRELRVIRHGPCHEIRRPLCTVTSTKEQLG